jgi:hypothetical protein
MSPVGLGFENDCVGEAQQQLQTTPFSHQRGCYIRTITASVQLENKILVVGLKGLVAKTNCLAVNRQS